MFFSQKIPERIPNGSKWIPDIHQASIKFTPCGIGAEAASAMSKMLGYLIRAQAESMPDRHGNWLVQLNSV